MSRWQSEKSTVAAAARRMSAMGLVTGASGNVSRKLEGADSPPLMAITPMGRRYDSMAADDVVVVDFDAESVEGDGTPSSESLLHLAIYRARPDVGAVIHTHSVFASVLAVAGRGLPAVIDEATIAVGGALQVSRYAFPASEELATNVCEALGDRKAALIRNHGMVGVGSDPEEALEICELVEHVAQVYVHATAIGGATELPPDVVESEVAIYRMRNPNAGGVD
ncbi:MAG: class II aldolase/adducin family protein [SAR202 cluster bacterium]|jgi:L-fuculose-phosphate aldolase|nr:class II aldolase [Chloroflexota bacterium]MQG57731.1 class II aldolase/adducin family protein [SAR202 cluster bacterium]MQG67779.1 class II aldolase/adducin family protein [SAR202 cluster bacterium]HAL48060.1 class II aldolase [Dehalococcoidia bacterium]|tara:strand:- start:3577 stop:4248 length:672 start_codon:yes stop_codon:yes gene_type:complete